MCRDVNRPYLLRPPVFFLGSTRLFSGRHFVISSNAGSDLKRSVGVSGRNSLSAISFSRSDQIDLLALLQCYDGFLPPGTTPDGSTQAFFLAGVITSVHIDNSFLEQPFDCVLDLNLVGLRADAEDILVLLLAH